ncbi:MAG: chorion class high-cysteine HCB protein 13 [Firmicutes bacterium]|nr:chorion class high-cysteine HCB protein 13 [Bacillota bacterium]
MFGFKNECGGGFGGGCSEFLWLIVLLSICGGGNNCGCEHKHNNCGGIDICTLFILLAICGR